MFLGIMLWREGTNSHQLALEGRLINGCTVLPEELLTSGRLTPWLYSYSWVWGRSGEPTASP